MAFVAAAALPRPAQAYSLFTARHEFDLAKDFLQPSDVAIGKDGAIYVADGVNSNIKVFDSGGAYRSSFGTKGAGHGQFEGLLGLASDAAGNIYAADAQNHRVQIFSAEGAFKRTIDVAPGKGDRATDPVDMAIDESKQQLYIVDNDNHHVLVYSLADFNQTARWAEMGELRDQLQYPFLITVGRDSSVFVVDVINTRVQVYSPRGDVVATIGGWGVEPGQFYRPKGVCTDSDNQVYVSDSYLGVIQVFSRYGNFKGIVADEKGAVLKWRAPVGIAIDGRQRLYVVDMLANKVQVYYLTGKTITVK
jgi:sugar lactone lactonase YvrE